MLRQSHIWNRRLLASLPRMLWIAMLSIHVPIFIAVWASIISDGGDLSRLGSGVSLVLANAFFALKIRDITFLQLRTRQQSVVALCLVVALVHRGSFLPNAAEIERGVPAAAVVMVIGAGITLRRIRSLALTLKDALASLCAKPMRRSISTSAELNFNRMTLAPIPLAPSVPRGPPARTSS